MTNIFYFFYKALFILEIFNVSSFFHFSFQFPDSNGQNKNKICLNMFRNSKRLVTSSRPYLFFIILFIKKDWVQKKKLSCLFHGLL